MKEKFLRGEEASVDYKASACLPASLLPECGLRALAQTAHGPRLVAQLLSRVSCASPCAFSAQAIDADAGLDEDWAEQAGRDAEDKYFGED